MSEPFEISSPETDSYNCVAWALGEPDKWWEAEEGFSWLPNIPFDDRLGSLLQFFEHFGFVRCTGPFLETGQEKIALFSIDGEYCEHVARQLPNGNWTSKLGAGSDVIHSLEAMEGGMYGDVVFFLKRRREQGVTR